MTGLANRRRFKVGNLGRVVTGKTPSTASPENFGSDYPFLTPTDMHGCKWARRTERGLSNTGASILRGQVPAGAVAISCIGWQMGKAILTDRPTYTNQQINTIIPNQSFDAEYLYYYFATRRGELLSIGSAGGVRTPIISKSSFEALDVEVPDLCVQRDVASVLSAYDDLIENNTRRIAILEEMARRIYEEWFVRFRFPVHEGVRMVESELGLVPEGWGLLKLGELVEFQKGKKPAAVFTEWAPGRAPALLIDALRGGGIEFADADRLVSVTRSDTIMVMDGSGSAQVFIGHEGVIGSTLGRYRVTNGAPVGAFWLYLLFLTRQSDIGGKNIGAAIPHANKDYIRSMPVPAPAAQVAAQFEYVVEPMFDLIQNLKAKTLTLRTTRDLLLPKLISGELDVSAIHESETLAA